MSSTLESSVTLDDVFVVVGAKRVPLAPELAGYLALEIAEGATQAAGEVDPRSVYIGEEGSVALVVRPRRDVPVGDAEASIRAILSRLLDASGSQTPALAAVARRRASTELGMLVEELEAALIPVNRAAGRRALARLAREVKRVTLGVGRNASLAPGEPAPRRASSPSYTAVREGAARPPPEPEPVRTAGRPAQEEPRSVPRSGFTEEPPTTARRELLQDPMVSPPVTSDAPVTRSTSPDASELPTVEVRKEQLVAALASRSAHPPKVEAKAGPDEVDHLLASFGVSSRGEHSQRNELKALVGLEPTPPPPGSEHAYDAPRSASESDVESLLAISDAGPPVAPRGSAARGVIASPPTSISPSLANEPFGASARGQTTVASAVSSPVGQSQPRAATKNTADESVPRTARAATGGADSREEAPEGVRGVPTAPSARRLAEMTSQPNLASPADRSLAVFAVVILVAGGLALWLLRPALFGAHDAGPPPRSAAATVTSEAPPPTPRCRASLVVTDAPTNAEILLRAGQAPVDVDKMPVGARLEFVATAEGYAPKRAVVPSGATWDSGPDGKPRYEVAVQLDHSRARPGAVDPWPAGEPGSEVGGKGSPGTVHLVTTPRGAEVWLLAGLGPTAQIDQLKCGGEVEVLVAGPTTLRKRLHVAEAEFVLVDGGPDRQAAVSAK